MKKILSVLSLLFLALAMVSCGKSGEFGRGNVMKLTFSTNPSTGFDWQYEFLSGEDRAQIVLDKEEYHMNENLDLVGAPSRRTYYFVAKKEGKQNLTFTYKRPWEGGETAYDVVYELSVDKNLKISCLSKMKGTVESDKELSYFPNPEFED